MNRLAPEQRFQIVQIYFENNGSVRNTFRSVRPFYGQHNCPSEQLIRLTLDRFCTAFTPNDNTHTQRRAYKRSHYFFKNDAVQHVTVNGDRYRAVIIEFVVLQMNNYDV